jgi:hypothetical protein
MLESNSPLWLLRLFLVLPLLLLPLCLDILCRGNSAFTHNQHFLLGLKEKKEKGEAKVVW